MFLPKHTDLFSTTPSVSELEGLAQIAAQLCSTPVACIVVRHPTLQDQAGCVGLDRPLSSGDVLLSVLPSSGELVVVPDVRADARLSGEVHGFRFFAGLSLVRNDGGVAGVLCVADHQPRLLTGGQPGALQALGRQIVTLLGLRQFAAETVAASEEGFARDRYADLIDRIDAIVWGADAETFLFTFVSKAAESLLGYPQEAWLAEGFWPSIIHPDDRRVVNECSIAVANREDHVLTYRMRTKAGRYRSFRDHVRLRERDGVLELFGIMVDVTELVEAEASVRASEEQYRQVIEAAPDGIGVHVEGKFVLANAELASIVGLASADDLIGQLVSRFVHRDYSDAVMRRQETLGRGKSVPLMPEKLVRADGTTVDVEVAALPVPFGSRMGVQVIVRDISQRLAAETKARAAETRLRVISAASNDALWEWSYRDGMIWMNDAYLRLFGVDKGSLSAAHWLSRVHPDDLHRVHAGVHDALEQQIPMWSDEYRFLNQAGQWINILSRCQFRFDADGIPSGLIGGMMDVTKLRAAEGQRREAEELYRVFLENSMIGVYIVKNWKIIYANPKACEMFGYTLDEIVEIPNLLSTIAPEHRGLVAERMSDRLAGISTSVVIMLRCIRKNGETFDAELLGSTAEIGGEKVLIGNFTDVTDRRRGEIALQRSEERLRLLVENVNEIIYSIDAEGRFIWLNSAFERVTGFHMDDWIGRPFVDVLAPESVGEATTNFRRLIGVGTAEPASYFIRTESGAVGEIEVSSRAVIVKGEVVGSVGVARDLSVRRSLERKLDQASRLSGLGQLAASVAHEFNNVLMGIQPFAEILTRTDQNREQIIAAGRYVRQSIDRGKSIASQILRFANPRPPELLPISLRPWLDDLAAESRAMVGPSSHIVLKVDGDACLCVDRRQMTQVMMNLILNARDAMPHGGAITIVADLVSGFEANEVQLIVQDEGSGVPTHLLPSVFDPLFTTKRSGTGLGLSIAQQIVTSHGGRLFARNIDGGGAAFHVILPASLLAHADGDTVSTTAGGRKRQLLLVEDDEVVAAGIVMLLELEGHTVEHLPDGTHALEAWSRLRPDVVILDENLPGASGAEIYEQLRERFGDVPAIFSTGHLHAAARADRPRVRLLMKPYPIDLLIETIEELLRTPAEPELVEG
jgi:PAS domain S-box-containing protein